MGCAPTYVVHGPQGGIATNWTWPKGFNQQTNTKDGIVPLWCSQRYDSIYNQSTLHLIEGENLLMISHLKETKAILSNFLKK